ILDIGRGPWLQNATVSYGNTLWLDMQADGNMHLLCGVANAVEAAGLLAVAGPGVHAAGVELAVPGMEAAAHHAGRQQRNRQPAHAALHLALHLLVRDNMDFAVTVGEVEQRALQRPPAVA